MLIEERYRIITNLLEEKKTITIEQLSNTLGVSKDTVRRDLIALEKQNLLKRTFGGAISCSKSVPSTKHTERLYQFNTSKDAIAKTAVELIKSHTNILFDNSTTVQAVAHLLLTEEMHAVTNSLPIAQILAQNPDCDISFLPGRLDKDQMYVIGSDTIEKLMCYNFDYCFLGVSAFDNSGLYTHVEEEGLVKKQMIKSSNLTIALADHSKFDTVDFYKIGNLNCIDILVTDEAPSDFLANALQRAGIKLLIAQPN